MSTQAHHALHQTRSRMAWQRAVRLACVVSLGGFAWGIALRAASLVLPVEVPLGWVFGGSALAALSSLLAGRLLLVPSLYQAAHLLDRTCGLEDRLTTALGIALGRVRSRFRDQVLEEATRALLHVDARRVVPIRRTLDPRVLVLAGGLLVWDLVLGGTTLPGTPAHRTRELIRAESRRLEQRVVRIGQSSRAQRLLRAAEQAERVQQAARALRQERITRQEAVERLRALARQVEDARRAAEGLLREELGTFRLPSRAALEQHSLALREFLSRWQSASTPQERERIREALQDLESQTPGLPPSIRSSLRRAREALRRGDRASVLQALGQAREDLQGMQRLASEMEALQTLAREVEATGQRIQAPTENRTAVEERDIVTGAAPFPVAPAGAKRAGKKEGPRPGDLTEGPNEGLRAGQGSLREKLGEPTERLGIELRRERLPGIPGGGKLTLAEAQGAGLRTQPQAIPTHVPLLVGRRSDEAMARERIPAPYRDLVRRYFLELGRRRE
ncbi:MAG: hypothetical protein QN172_01225 [Armatimonadota bacterium]|nr:hypothetical protein [Armatimonadota bacterium]MDR7439561.1 hypothetical protein [Armatimonadota bacterium]MDR7568868.1 hypothetical protein [Armatimonadota bacterium]MDR7601059.1 hypothetical protein [Armatimonadota bacterium]